MIRFGDECWPVVLMQIIGRNAKENYAQASAVLRALYERPEKMITITCMRHASREVAEREALAEWSNELGVEGRTRTVTSIVIVESPIARGMLTALLWVHEPWIPLRLASSRTEAIDTACELAGARGLMLPASLSQSSSRWFSAGDAIARNET